MGELMGSVMTFLNVATALVLYAGIFLVAVTLRKVSKDVADVKREVASLEEFIMRTAPEARSGIDAGPSRLA